MIAAFRIPGAGRLKQAETTRFSFDGQSYAGVEGDTLASALLANGVHLVVRAAFCPLGRKSPTRWLRSSATPPGRHPTSAPPCRSSMTG